MANDDDVDDDDEKKKKRSRKGGEREWKSRVPGERKVTAHLYIHIYNLFKKMKQFFFIYTQK